MRDFSFSGYGFLPFGKRDKDERELSLKEKLIERLEQLKAPCAQTCCSRQFRGWGYFSAKENNIFV